MPTLRVIFRGIAALALILTLAACGSGQRQSPVASNEEVGSVREDGGEDKPVSYVTREGDTLRKIAARPEVYGDPNLWPILQEANAAVLGEGDRVNQGLTLSIPRDLSTTQIEEAQEKARQVAAANKMRERPKPRPKAEPETVEAKPKAEAKPAPAPVQPAQPVPQAKKGGMLLPVLLVLLLLLAALAGVLYYFMRRDSKEDAQ